MTLYEHVFLARQDSSTQQVDEMVERFSEVITSGGGKVVRTELWGLKPTAYRIRKNRKAHYVMLLIDAPYAPVAEMERLMGLSTDVLRFLTLKVESHSAEPSVMMRKSDDRGDRRPGGGAGGRPPRGRRDDNRSESGDE